MRGTSKLRGLADKEEVAKQPGKEGLWRSSQSGEESVSKRKGMIHCVKRC